MIKYLTGRFLIQIALLFMTTATWAQEDGVAQDLPRSQLRIETDSAAHMFRVQVADDPAKRSKGLMFRRDLPADEGMLFMFPLPEPASFWMKNTYIPLDLIFIRANGRIANIEHGKPHDLTGIRSRGRVMAVLELTAGTASRLGIVPGDMVRHKALGNWTTDTDDTP